MSDGIRSGEALRVTYGLRCRPAEDPAELARLLAYEQTVELPDGAFAAGLRERVAGRVEGLEPSRRRGRWRAVISYPRAVLGDGDVPQLLNVLFGNVSMQRGVRVETVEWPEWLRSALPGPRWGVSGLRTLFPGSRGRPLFCAALKPVGLPPGELAARAGAFARAGVELIKDDHGLAEQRAAPFEERVARCQEAVAEASARSGTTSLYLPNLTGPVDAMGGRLERLRELGIRGALVAPLLIGPDGLRRLAAGSGLVLLAHPSLSGAYFQPGHGIAPEVLLGDLFRLLGADGVIYPNTGGRFPFSQATCDRINRRLRQPLGAVPAAFPVPGGGIDAARIGSWARRYGADTIFLLGSSLYRAPDLEEAARRMRTAGREATTGGR